MGYSGKSNPLTRGGLCSGIVLGVVSMGAVAAHADSIDVGDPDWAVRWDNNVKYSNAFRVAPQNSAVSGNAMPYNSNTNDGDRNFKRGLISNRIDLLSEMDIVYQENTGLRVSAAAWYDSVYNGNTANTTPNSSNNIYEGSDRFPKGTKTLNGKDVELMDALVFHKFELPDDQTLTLRAGRFAQIYGETLFMGANGIAAAQGPVDAIKAASVPNSQFKEIMRPVGQVATNWQTGSVMLGAYYQFEYRPDRLPGVGSYFSVSDAVGPGAEAGFMPGSLPGNPAGSDLYFSRGKDMLPNSQGQGGVEVRWKALGNWEFGLYAANYHEKGPATIYAMPSGGAAFTTFADGLTGRNIGTYRAVYNQNVQTYGGSFATVIGDTNISGELSVRHNQSLATAQDVGGGLVVTDASRNNSNNIAYLTGNTVHANISAISILPDNGVWDTAAVTAEIGANHLIGITDRGQAAANANGLFLNPTSTHTAVAGRVVIEPSFFQVMPNVDVTTPLGVGYGFYGHSALGSHLGAFNNEGCSDISIGIKAVYQKVWHASLTYTTFLGPKGQGTTQDANRYLSYKQDLYDRDFVSFSLSRAF